MKTKKEAAPSAKPDKKDFAEMDAAGKADAAIGFLRYNRSKIFQPGKDMKIYKFIIEALEEYKLYN